MGRLRSIDRDSADQAQIFKRNSRWLKPECQAAFFVNSLHDHRLVITTTDKLIISTCRPNIELPNAAGLRCGVQVLVRRTEPWRGQSSVDNSNPLVLTSATDLGQCLRILLHGSNQTKRRRAPCPNAVSFDHAAFLWIALSAPQIRQSRLCGRRAIARIRERASPWIPSRQRSPRLAVIPSHRRSPRLARVRKLEVSRPVRSFALRQACDEDAPPGDRQVPRRAKDPAWFSPQRCQCRGKGGPSDLRHRLC
jgi:hypothetical protein